MNVSRQSIPPAHRLRDCARIWDALDEVGDHTLFAALSTVTVLALVLVFASRGELLPALYSLGAVWLVFLVFVAIKSVRAFAHTDQHQNWEWLDFRLFRDFVARRCAVVRATTAAIVAPSGEAAAVPRSGARRSRWESSAPTEGDPASDAYLRWYPKDFKCPKSGQRPPGIPAGEYEITWLRPWRWRIRRPTFRLSPPAITGSLVGQLNPHSANLGCQFLCVSLDAHIGFLSGCFLHPHYRPCCPGRQPLLEWLAA
jgi:hypothetical protein